MLMLLIFYRPIIKSNTIMKSINKHEIKNDPVYQTHTIMKNHIGASESHYSITVELTPIQSLPGDSFD